MNILQALNKLKTGHKIKRPYWGYELHHGPRDSLFTDDYQEVNLTIKDMLAEDWEILE